MPSAHKGFTLVELLVVISVIAILSVVGVTVFTSVQKGARDSKRKADVNAVSNAYEANFNSNTGTYNLSPSFFAGGVYPSDPINTSPYTYSLYGATLPGPLYNVCARLEAGSGGNSSDINGTPQANGPYYCKHQQQ